MNKTKPWMFTNPFSTNEINTEKTDMQFSWQCSSFSEGQKIVQYIIEVE